MPHSSPMHSTVSGKPSGLSNNPVVLTHPQITQVMQVKTNHADIASFKC